MSDQPSDYRYTESHEWVADHGDGSVTVGITDHAQSSLGDLVFVELPETGASYASGDVVAVVESVKAASDIYAPLAGEVFEVNNALEDTPEAVNEDPFGEGWLFKLKPESTEALTGLLDAEAYQKVVDAEA